MYDWRREVRSHDPSYVRWNQVILRAPSWRQVSPTARTPWSTGARAARRSSPMSRSSRTAPASASGDVVIKRDLEQWFLRITAYADELLEGLDALDGPKRVKTMQRN